MIVGAIIFQLLTHEHGREGQFLEQSGWMLWVQECQTEKKKKAVHLVMKTTVKTQKLQNYRREN